MALTNNDIKVIRTIVEASNKQLEEKMNEKISHLPTKDEFFQRMDFLAGELKMIREELPTLSRRVAVHDTQIAKIASHINLSL